MELLKKYGLLILLALLLPAGLVAQTDPEKAARLEEGKLIFTIDLRWDDEQLEKVQELFSLDSLLIAGAFEGLQKVIADSVEWRLRKMNQNLVEVYKEVQKMESAAQWKDDIIMMDDRWFEKAPVPPTGAATYGTNEFSRKSVFDLEGGRTLFLLTDHEDAERVYLSGSFNNWSTMRTSMERTDSGWVAVQNLPPGEHFYKFIVDGRWMHDPNNERREKDGHRGYNSIYFKYNYTFDLEGYTDARRVIVAGSFNGWDERELRMSATEDGWELPVYMKEGTHAYKFIVDREWILDPGNPVVRPDGRGNYNSFIGIGDTIFFRLNGYTDAEEVVLAGSFNAWNPGELFMTKTDNGWELPYVLAPGNYEYKFVVDGRWITDPGNPYTTGTGDFINSFLAYEPNHTFNLEYFPAAESVIVTGSFNGWSQNDYRMIKRDGIWHFELHLKPGKYLYKLIVDGEWILDPGNPLWEENEFGTGNSILWIEP